MYWQRSECPKLWTSYHNLYRLHYLSSYTTSRIAIEAEKLANDAYTLLSTISSSCETTQNIQSNKCNSSTAFAAQTQYYQAFKTNMTLAYQLSLELSITFAKCCDLVYDFRFPKIQEKFDPSCMEARGSGRDGSQNDTSTTADEDQLVVVGLLPAIWSRKRNGSDVEQAWTLVSKAVVLLWRRLTLKATTMSPHSLKYQESTSQVSAAFSRYLIVQRRYDLPVLLLACVV